MGGVTIWLTPDTFMVADGGTAYIDPQTNRSNDKMGSSLCTLIRSGDRHSQQINMLHNTVDDWDFRTESETDLTSQ